MITYQQGENMHHGLAGVQQNGEVPHSINKLIYIEQSEMALKDDAQTNALLGPPFPLKATGVQAGNW